MNFIEINIGGKRRGLRFNQYAIENYFKRIDWNNYVQSSEIVAMIFAGLIGDCYAKGIDPDFEFATVCDWVDALYLSDEGQKSIKDVNDVLTETQNYKFALEKIKDRIRLMQPTTEKKNRRKTK